MDPHSPFPEQYWSQPPEVLIQALGTSANGLDQLQAQQRLKGYGPNRLSDRKKASDIGLFLKQFKSPITLILLFATGISAIVKDWGDALIILVIVFSSAALSFFQERNANHASEKLRSQIAVKSEVIRNNEPQTIPTWQIVPGDVVLLSAGSLVPADGLVLEAKDFFVNQAALTGESLPVEKSPGIISAAATLTGRTNMVFMGTSVRSGSARVLVVKTGGQAAIGQLASRLTLRPPETEFERGIKHLGSWVSAKRNHAPDGPGNLFPQRVL